MLQGLLFGAIAGAAGTIALNVATYIDMLVRGRSSSSVPAEVAAQLADSVGVTFVSTNGDDNFTANRKEALGALMGYGVGLWVGAGYGLIRPALRMLPLPVAGALAGAAAMAASDVPATQLGVTDPAEWGATGWAADIVPHLAYGLVTALVYEAIADR